jgi:hypothetical protein
MWAVLRLLWYDTYLLMYLLQYTVWNLPRPNCDMYDVGEREERGWWVTSLRLHTTTGT